MATKITHDDIDRQFYELLKDPERFLELTNQLVEQNPDDSHAYFGNYPLYKAAVHSLRLRRQAGAKCEAI